MRLPTGRLRPCSHAQTVGLLLGDLGQGHAALFAQALEAVAEIVVECA